MLRLVHPPDSGPVIGLGIPPESLRTLPENDAKLVELALNLSRLALALVGESAQGRGSEGDVSRGPARSTVGVDDGGPALALRAQASPTIEQDVQSFGRHLATLAGYSEVERRKAVASVRRLASDCGWVRAENIARADVIDWLVAYVESGGPGARKTAKNILTRLRAFGEFLVDAQRLPESPFTRVRIPRAGKGRKRHGAKAFSWEEASRLVAVAEAAEARMQRDRPWQWRRLGPLRSTFYRFVAYTGLRYSEAGRQRWSDVDLDAGVLWTSLDKADRGDPVPLAPPLVAALRSWRDWSRGDTESGRGDSAGLVFPRRPSHHSLLSDMAEAGVTGKAHGRDGQWHRFRKALATEYARMGVHPAIAQKNLRHADSSLTLCHYTTLELAEQAHAAARLKNLGQSAESGIDSRGEACHTAGASLKSMPLSSAPSRPETTPAEGGIALETRNFSPLPAAGGRPFQPGCTPARDEWSRGESSPRPIPPAQLAAIHDAVKGLNAAIDAIRRGGAA